jgi:hypothetical protein
MGGISRREQIVAAAARLFGENGFDIAAITEGHVAAKPEPTIAGFTVDLTLDMESIGRHVRVPARIWRGSARTSWGARCGCGEPLTWR